MRKFDISGNNKYYVSSEVAKHAIGFSSLGAYITHLKLENDLAKEELGSKVDRVECSTDEILKLVKDINSGIDPKSVVECFNKISDIYETLKTSIVRDAAYTKPQQAAMMEELKKLAGFLIAMRKIFGQS
jgi:hypothetical protein